MIVFPLIRVVGLDAPTAWSRVETVPMFVRSVRRASAGRSQSTSPGSSARLRASIATYSGRVVNVPQAADVSADLSLSHFSGDVLLPTEISCADEQFQAR